MKFLSFRIQLTDFEAAILAERLSEQELRSMVLEASCNRLLEEIVRIKNELPFVQEVAHEDV